MINFKKYDKENPKIYKLFVRFAKIARAKGFHHYSAKGIFEVIRWHTAAHGNDSFKLNNYYHADYARKFMNDYPNYAGFFKTRELKAERVK